MTADPVEFEDVYDDVLLPTDGSEAAGTAVDRALDLAEQYDATLHALFVADVGEYSTATFRPEVLDVQVEAGRRVTGEIADRAKDHGLDAVDVVGQGTPFEGIREYVRENDVDVVVMGTHGRTGVERHLLGSVTERVVRDVDAPTLVVPIDVDGG